MTALTIPRIGVAPLAFGLAIRQTPQMKNFFRWASFTAAITVIGLALVFGLLFLGRLYIGLQQPAFVFTMLMLFSGGVTVAAINFASKLEDEEGEESDAGGSLRLPTRAVAEGEGPDG